jgi:hypothetical protein
LTSSTDGYDPHEHAERLGLQIEYQRLNTAYGLYVSGRSLVLLRPRMKVVTERSVLAHEILHHLHSDRRMNGAWNVRQERRADEGAALNLISPQQWDDVTRWSSDPREWAIELRVTGDILLAYMNAVRVKR